jgi:hypothetical protein
MPRVRAALSGAAHPIGKEAGDTGEHEEKKQNHQDFWQAVAHHEDHIVVPVAHDALPDAFASGFLRDVLDDGIQVDGECA